MNHKRMEKNYELHLGKVTFSKEQSEMMNHIMGVKEKAAELKGKQEILRLLDEKITDSFIGSSVQAFKFAEDFSELWIKYVTSEEIKTPEFKERFKKMLH